MPVQQAWTEHGLEPHRPLSFMSSRDLRLWRNSSRGGALHELARTGGDP